MLQTKRASIVLPGMRIGFWSASRSKVAPGEHPATLRKQGTVKVPLTMRASSTPSPVAVGKSCAESMWKAGALPWTTPSVRLVSPSPAKARSRIESMRPVRFSVLATVKSQAR